MPGSVSFDPEEAAAAEEILAVLHDFREVEADIYADPPPPDIVRREVSPYLADPMQGEVIGTLYDMYTAGIAFEGRPVSEPTVVEVRLDDTPPTATVLDCVDVANWRSVFQETGDSVPGDALPDRYVMKLEAQLYPEYGWLFENFAIEEGTQC